jgi:AhpD family alkylhydroperoxidase
VSKNQTKKWPWKLDQSHSNVVAMTTKRLSLSSAAPRVYRAIAALDASVDFDPPLQELIRIRASRLNGCTYCIDSHARDARQGGESERRIWALSAWRETPFFDERERAALALTEAMTRLPDEGVPDDVYAEAARHFPDEELGNLIGAIIAINAWNRVGVGTAMRPPAEVDEAAA